MKKITFVEKQDSSSYDPVSLFFTKTKPQSLSKASQSRQNSNKPSSIKASVNNKYEPISLKQTKPILKQHISLTQKKQQIISKQYEKLREQTIFDSRQKERELMSKKPNKVLQASINVTKGLQISKGHNLVQHNIIMKKSSLIQPQMVFDSIVKQEVDENDNGDDENRLNTTEKSSSLIENSTANKPPSQIQSRSSQMQSTTKPKHQQSQPQKQLNATNNLKQPQDQQLQKFIKQYQQRIQQLQIKIQSLTKIQQKYNKLVKQHKQCKQRNINYSKLQQELKQTKLNIKKLLSSTENNHKHNVNNNTHQQQSIYIPYSAKRQYLLLNQINQLKKTNRELVLRIKNYKGTDLVSMAMSINKEEIGRQFDAGRFYIEEQQSNQRNKMNVEIQSQLSRLINLVYCYLQTKTGRVNNTVNKKNPITIQSQQIFLQQIASIAQNLSLNYLLHYNISPLPKCNQDAVNLYDQIQRQRENILQQYVSKVKGKIIPVEEINFAISQNNLEIINDLRDNQEEMRVMKKFIDEEINYGKKVCRANNTKGSNNNPDNRPSTSHSTLTKPSKPSTTNQPTPRVLHLLHILSKRSSLSSMFHIQSICYFTFLKQLLQQMLNNLSTKLLNLSGRLREMNDIYQLGGTTARESLYLYLQTHLEELTLIIPNLNIEVNQVKSAYSEINNQLIKSAG